MPFKESVICCQSWSKSADLLSVKFFSFGTAAAVVFQRVLYSGGLFFLLLFEKKMKPHYRRPFLEPEEFA